MLQIYNPFNYYYYKIKYFMKAIKETFIKLNLRSTLKNSLFFLFVYIIAILSLIFVNTITLINS